MAPRPVEGETEAFAYGGGDLDPASVGETERGTDPTGQAVSVDDADVTVDGHGDIVAATGADGAVSVTAYDPWGTTDDGEGGAGSFGYQGDDTDPATETVWMGARVYDPDTGTFTSRDTWSGDTTDPVTLNRDTYANANPVNYWDPTGASGLSLTPSATPTLAQYIAALGSLSYLLQTLSTFYAALRASPGASAVVAGVVMIMAAVALVTVINYRTNLLEDTADDVAAEAATLVTALRPEDGDEDDDDDGPDPCDWAELFSVISGWSCCDPADEKEDVEDA